MEAARIMPKPIPVDGDGSSMEIYMVQKKEQPHFSMWNHVSPDWNDATSKDNWTRPKSQPTKIDFDDLANDNNTKHTTHKVNSTFNMTSNCVSPEAHPGCKSPCPTIESESNRGNQKSHTAAVTPLNMTTPNRTHLFPPSPMTGPLKSPFVSSMNLLDSKLASLRKSQCKLDDKIQQLNTWLDESAIEDSFDGELVFDESEVGRWRGVDGRLGKINGIVGKCCAEDNQKAFESQQNNWEECEDDVGEQSNGVSSDPLGDPKVETCLEPTTPTNERSIGHLSRLNQLHYDFRVTPSDYYEVTDSVLSHRSSSDKVLASHSDSPTGLLRLNETPEHQQSLDDSVRSVQVKYSPNQTLFIQNDSRPTQLRGFDLAASSQSDGICDYMHASESEAVTEQKSVSIVASGPRSVRTSQTNFFSSNEVHENHAFSTPFGCNANCPLRCELNNVHRTASNGDGRGAVTSSTCEFESSCDSGCSRSDSCENDDDLHYEEIHSTLLSAIDTPTSSSFAPSACSIDFATKQVLWRGDSPFQIEASSDMNHIMSNPNIDPLFLHNATSSNTSCPSSNNFSSINACAHKTLQQNRCSSPIKPKKLYNTNEDTGSSSDEDENDRSNVASATTTFAQHSLLGENHGNSQGEQQPLSFAATMQCQHEGETADSHNIMVGMESRVASAFMSPVVAGLGSELSNHSLEAVDDMRFHAKQSRCPLDVDLIDKVASSPSAYSQIDFTKISNGELVQHLLALVNILRCKLTEANAAFRYVKEERDALSFERDYLLRNNQEYSTSKLDRTLIDNHHPALASTNKETTQLRIDKVMKEDEFNDFRRREKDTGHVSTQMKDVTVKTSPKTAPTTLSEQISRIMETALSIDRIESEEDKLGQTMEIVESRGKSHLRSGQPRDGRLGRSDENCLELSYLLYDTCSNGSPYSVPAGIHGAKRLDTDNLSHKSTKLSPDPYTVHDIAGSQSVELSDFETKFSEEIQSTDQLDDFKQQLIWKERDHQIQLKGLGKENDTVFSGFEQTSCLLLLLESSNESITPTLIDLQNNTSTCERQLLKLREQSDSTKETLQLGFCEKEHSESKLQVAPSAIQSLTHKFQFLENQQDNLVEKLELAEHRLRIKQNEIDLLSSERNKRGKTIEFLQSALSAKEHEKAEVEESLSHMTAMVDNLRLEIGEKETIISSLHKAIISLRSEMSSCSERLENAENKLQEAIASNEYSLNVVREMNQLQTEADHCISVALAERDKATAYARHQSSLLFAAENEKQSRLGSMQSTVLQLKKRVDAATKELASKDIQIVTLREEKSCIEARLRTFHELQKRVVTECKSVQSRLHGSPLEKAVRRASLVTVDQCSENEEVLNPERIQDMEKHAEETRALLISLKHENTRLFTENNRVRTRAAILSVIALQLKMRMATSKKKERRFREKIYDAELSLAELNNDRRRLVEDSLALREEIKSVANEKEVLLAKNHECNQCASSSKALVLDGECCVEAVNCMIGTSDQQRLESQVYKRKLQFTISSLALALIKLKIRNINVLKEKIQLEDRVASLEKRFRYVGEHLFNIVTQRDSLNDFVFELRTVFTTELQTLNKHATQTVINLLSKANKLKEELVELQSEKEDLQSKNDSLKEVGSLNQDIEKLKIINELQLQSDVADPTFAQTDENKTTGQANLIKTVEKLACSSNILLGDKDDCPPKKESESRNNETDCSHSSNDVSSRCFNPSSNPIDACDFQIVASTRNPTKKAIAANTQNNNFAGHEDRCYHDINDRNKSEHGTSSLDIGTKTRNQEFVDSKQQCVALQSFQVISEEDCSQPISEREDSHQLQTGGVSILKSNPNLEKHALCELKKCLEREKEVVSLLRCELEKVISEKDDMENSMKSSQQTMMNEMNCLLGAIASLKSDKESLDAQLRECKVTTLRFSQRVNSLESESELAKKLRHQLESQLNERMAETDALKRTVTSQTATIKQLSLKMQLFSQERDADIKKLSAMHCDIKSLTAERDTLCTKLTEVTADFDNYRARLENPKQHSSLGGSAEVDGSDGSVKTFDSCAYVGTVCEEILPASPGTDITSILSSYHVSEEDIPVYSKMHKLPSLLSEVQQERSSLRQEVKQRKTTKESHENEKQTYALEMNEVEKLFRTTSASYNSLLAQNQNEILRLNKELEASDQTRLANFTSPISALPTSGNCPKFELSLETPRVSNMVAKNNIRSSPRPRLKSKSPPSSSQIRSKERFEIKRGQSIFSMFRDTKKSGRKDKIKYREANKDARSVDTEPLSPGEKRKREQAEQMMKSLRQRCEI